MELLFVIIPFFYIRYIYKSQAYICAILSPGTLALIEAHEDL